MKHLEGGDATANSHERIVRSTNRVSKLKKRRRTKQNVGGQPSGRPNVVASCLETKENAFPSNHAKERIDEISNHANVDGRVPTSRVDLISDTESSSVKHPTVTGTKDAPVIAAPNSCPLMDQKCPISSSKLCISKPSNDRETYQSPFKRVGVVPVGDLGCESNKPNERPVNEKNRPSVDIYAPSLGKRELLNAMDMIKADRAITNNRLYNRPNVRTPSAILGVHSQSLRKLVQEESSSSMGAQDSSHDNTPESSLRGWHHPILGEIAFPSVTRPTDARSKNRPRKRSCDDRLPFPKSALGEITKRSTKVNTRFHLGDGMNIPFHHLAFPNPTATTTQRSFQHATSPPVAAPTQTNVLGKLRIVAERGATIRECFDMDESERQLGKLQTGDVRYFVEKRLLPPPPDEEDCSDIVNVNRYKIFLQDDSTGTGRTDQGFGWISDRARYADDMFQIAQEVKDTKEDAINK
eukprot:scaffold90036_cov55-Attheya_sp.AAC.3